LKVEKILRGRPIVPGYVKGRALVSAKPISFLGEVDGETGVIVGVGHDLEGESVKGKVLCFPSGHGSTVGSYVIYNLAKRGLGPAAIINKTADPVVVVGAIIGEVPMIDKIDTAKIKTGDLVEVDAHKGVVKIFKERQ